RPGTDRRPQRANRPQPSEAGPRCAETPTRSFRSREPAAREPGALQPATYMRVLFHHPPNNRTAVIFDHRADGSLIDAKVVAVDPAKTRNRAAMAKRNIGVKAQIERIQKPVH